MRVSIRGFLASCLCFAALCSADAFAAMRANAVEWTVGKQRFSGYLVYDDANQAKRPGLVMVPDWLGVTASAVEEAKRIAGDGYVVLVADVYGKGVRPKDPKAASEQVKKMYADRKVLRARAAGALAFLRARAKTVPVDPARVGAFGYCFGGATVLELARSGADLAGVVSFHGGLGTSMPAQSGTIKSSVLVLNGADDTYVSADEIRGFETEMKAAGADWQFVNYSGAVHCFALKAANSPPGCVYNERAANRAYRAMRDFFTERFGI
jgi:dienelactone hydrolase